MFKTAAIFLGLVAPSGAAVAQGAPATDHPCVVEPSEVLELGAPIAGVLEAVYVDRGDTVRAGQLVAALHADVEAAQLRLAEARAGSDAEILARQAALSLVVAESTRMQTLLDRNVASAQQAEEVAARLETARMDLRLAILEQTLANIEAERARAAIEQRRIHSPINGVVLRRNRGPGEYAFQETHVLTVARVDVLHVEAYLPIAHRAEIATGDTVTVTLEHPLGAVVSATVNLVDSIFDAATGTFGIRAVIDNEDGAIAGGQSCRLHLGLM